MERWQAAARQVLMLQAAMEDARGEVEAIMQTAVDTAIRALPDASGAVIEMVEGDEAVHRVGTGTSADSIGLRLALDRSLSGLCIRSGEPQLCRDTETDPRVDAAACRRLKTRSMVIAPLHFHGRTVGTLKLFAANAGAFDERDLVISQLLTTPINLALANAERARLAQSHETLARRFAATFDQAAVGIAHVGVDGAFLRVNERFCEITGYSATELVEEGFQQITHPADLRADLAHVASLLAGKAQRYSMEKRYVRKDGTLVWVNLTVSLVRRPDGAPDFFVAVIEDISARKEAEVLAAYDPLTGLPNRRMVLAHLAHQLELMPLHGDPLAVAYLDVDRFKGVNDRFGHAEGDRCLVAIANALRASMRSGDLLGRMAGDEFVLVLSDAGTAAAQSLLVRLCAAIEQLPERRTWDVSISAGAIVVGPGIAADPEDVLHAADQIMYRVKRDRTGEPIVEQFTPGASMASLRSPGGFSRRDDATAAPKGPRESARSPMR